MFYFLKKIILGPLIYEQTIILSIKIGIATIFSELLVSI